MNNNADDAQTWTVCTFLLLSYTPCTHSVFADAAGPQQCGFQGQDIARTGICRLCVVQYCVVFSSVELYGLMGWRVFVIAKGADT